MEISFGKGLGQQGRCRSCSRSLGATCGQVGASLTTYGPVPGHLARMGLGCFLGAGYCFPCCSCTSTSGALAVPLQAESSPGASGSHSGRGKCCWVWLSKPSSLSLSSMPWPPPQICSSPALDSILVLRASNCIEHPDVASPVPNRAE